MIERDKKLDYFERIANWTSWSIFRVKLVRFVKINKNILIFFQYVPRPSVGVQQQQQQQQTNNRANNVVSASAANARTRKGPRKTVGVIRQKAERTVKDSGTAEKK